MFTFAHGFLNGAETAEAATLVLHAATYNASTYLVGDEIVSGTPTFVHTSDIYAKDKDGDWGVFGENERVIKGARRVLDPAKLFGTFIGTRTDSSINITCIFNGVSTYGLMKDGEIEANRIPEGATVTSTVVDTELKIFVGSKADVYSLTFASNGLSGSVPNLDDYTGLRTLAINTNSLSGNFPSISLNTALVVCYIHANSFDGSIPNISNNTLLSHFYFNTNSFTGNVPDMSNNTALVNVRMYSNSLTGYEGGWPNKAFDFNVSNNALTETAVNLILTEADADGIATGTTINLTGGTNAAPTGVGATAKANLISNGATVTTN